MDVSSHRNSLDLARFALAVAVLVSHHFGLSGFNAPTIPFIQVSLGHFAVYAFFAISGFLMYMSLSRSNNFFVYFSARTLRIAPNLIIAVTITSILLMVIFSNFENSHSHISYITRDSISFIREPSYIIEGIFTNHPDRGVNGSLWTLQYEFFMYIVIFLIFLLPRRLIGYALFSVVAVASLPYLQSIENSKRVLTFNFTQGELWTTGFNFMAGALIAHFWCHISQRRVLSFFAAVICISTLILFAPELKSWMMGVFWVPFLLLCMSPLGSRFSRMGDASYGIYIYAFPIQQTAISLIGNFWISLLLSLVLTIIVGYVCWHMFEKRILSRRKGVAAYLSAGTAALMRLCKQWTVRGSQSIS